jgi:hypothetical protein
VEQNYKAQVKLRRKNSLHRQLSFTPKEHRSPPRSAQIRRKT